MNKDDAITIACMFAPIVLFVVLLLIYGGIPYNGTLIQ